MTIQSLFSIANLCFAAGLILVVGMTIGCSNDQPELPETAKKPVTEDYHGVKVIDNYRWLEDGNDPAVHRWDKAQDEYTSAILANIEAHTAITKRLEELYHDSPPIYYYFQTKEAKLFTLKDQPPKDQPFLVMVDSPNDLTGEKVVVDPNALDPSGATAIDFYYVSPDARLVAVSLSKNGTEVGDLHVYEIATGEPLEDVVPRVNGPTAGGSVAWAADGSGFYYTHYPREGERPAEDMSFYQQIYYHKLRTGTEEDIYVLGEDFPRIAEIDLKSSPDGKYIIAIVANGDGGEYAHYLRDAEDRWHQLTQYSDMITRAGFGPDQALYLVSSKDAPRGKILRLEPGETRLSQAKVIVEESEGVIRGFTVTDSRIYVRELIGGPSQVHMYDYTGALKGSIPILPVSSVGEMVSLGGDSVLFKNGSYTQPTDAYTYDPISDKVAPTAIKASSPADFSDVEVLREHAVSKDGTKVPMSILRRKGTVLDGNNPTILYGYGGYGICQSPYYDRTLSLWLDNGGVYVIANLRGGGEFGEEWHRAGYLTNKQNVFDDFIACARYLIDTGYTKPARLAIKGGSNGGLLVGATMVQQPDLFRAVLCQKGVLDMLRVELDPNGAFNVTEYGTVEDPEHFKALYAYSPYTNIEEGQRYPDVLFTADIHDGRVDPSNSRKMAARLQAVADPETMVLLKIGSGAGHGHGSPLSKKIAGYADAWAFLFDRLGVEYK